MTNIDKDKVYTLHEIAKNNWLYWLKSFSTISRWVEKDLKYWKILNPVKMGSGTGTRYFIKGENIIKFIAMFEDGSLHLASKPKGGDIKMNEEQTQTPETTETPSTEATPETTPASGAEETATSEAQPEPENAE